MERLSERVALLWVRKMGDDLDTNVWEEEVKGASTDFVENDSDGGSSSGDDGDSSEEEETKSKSVKLEKKRKRFEEMKAKKREKLSESSNQSSLTSSVSPNSSGDLKTKDMCHMLNGLLQHPDTRAKFSPSHFYVIKPQVKGKAEEGGSFSGKATQAQLQPGSEGDNFVDAVFSSGLSVGQLKKKDKLKEEGAPIAIIVCSGARRCQAVIKRIASSFRCHVGKLYSKHFKLHEQVSSLKSKVALAVGTPDRITQLLDAGALSLCNLKCLLLDMSHTSKSFTMLDARFEPVYSQFRDFVLQKVRPAIEKTDFRLTFVDFGKEEEHEKGGVSGRQWRENMLRRKKGNASE